MLENKRVIGLLLISYLFYYLVLATVGDGGNICVVGSTVNVWFGARIFIPHDVIAKDDVISERDGKNAYRPSHNIFA
jgi:hypothetical protein